MITPISLYCKNICTFNTFNLKFTPGNVRCIKGINLDNLLELDFFEDLKKDNLEDLIQQLNKKGVEFPSNGSGKSSILEAFYILVTGSPLRKDVRIADLIKDGTESLYIKGVFKNTLEGYYFTLIREFNLSSNQKYSAHKHIELDIELDDSNSLSFSGIDAFNLFIFQEFGINKEDFLNYFIIQKDSFTPFFKMSDTKKKELVNRFTNLTFFEKTEPKIKKKIEELEKEINSLNNSLSAKEEVKKTYLENKSKLNEETFKLEKEEKINKKKLEIKELEGEIESFKIKIKDKESFIEIQQGQNTNNLLRKEKLKTLLQDKEKSILQEKGKIDVFNTAINTINSIISNEESSKKEKEKEISNILVQLMDFIECPNCKFIFSYKNSSLNKTELELNKKKYNLDVENLDTSITNKNKELNILKESIKNINNSISVIDIEKNRINKIIRKIDSYIDSNNEIIKISNKNIKNWNSNITNNKISITKINESIKNIEEEKLDTTIFDKSIESVEIEIKNLTNQISEKKITLEKRNSFQIILQKFKNYVTFKTIKEIEKYFNYFLNEFNSEFQIKISPSKTLSDGKTVRDELDISIIYRDDNENKKFGRFSNGERSKMILANILTFQNLINNSSKNGGLDFIGIDEILESVDSYNLKEISNLLNKINQTIDLIIISKTNFDLDTLYVVKYNKSSKILNLEDF